MKNYQNGINDLMQQKMQTIREEIAYFGFTSSTINISLPTCGEDAEQVYAKRLEKLRWNILEIGKSEEAKAFSGQMISEYAFFYASLVILEGMFHHATKSAQASREGKEIVNGNGRQHWIPRAYLRKFQHKGRLRYWFLDKETGELKGKLESCRLGDFFQESRYDKGKFYDPVIEIIFSKLENDFGSMSRETDGLFAKIVALAYASTLVQRTKARRDSGNSIMDGTIQDLAAMHLMMTAFSEHISLFVDPKFEIEGLEGLEFFFTEEPAFYENDILFFPLDRNHVLFAFPKNRNIEKSLPHIIIYYLGKYSDSARENGYKFFGSPNTRRIMTNLKFE